MSTHAQIGVKMPDGAIVGCYVHYDGATMQPRIESYLEEYTTTNLAMVIMTAQARGGIRSFHSPGHRDIRASTELLDDVGQPLVIDDANWNEWHYGAAYKYLVDYKTGIISMRSKY